MSVSIIDAPEASTSTLSFAELGLRAELLRALKERGYETPTPIQAGVIPTILEGSDILAAAQTGTGKTAGFTLPLLQRLMASAASSANGRRPHPRRASSARPVRALILTPTRELAAQVEESVQTYGKHLPLTSLSVFGGVGMTPQVRALTRGIDILVATPGRLLDHVSQRTVDLSQVEILVLDEADRMLDMGFIRDIRRVLALLPTERQTLLFSATFSPDIRTLANEFLQEPKQVDVGVRNAESPLVTQSVYLTSREQKRDVLVHLIRQHSITQALVFTRTKHGADRLAAQLEQQGISTVAIHSNRSQSQRTRALADFKTGAVKVLVATDIAARGLDIIQLPHVFNYDLPNIPEDYVHRIGRTGRAGSPGQAISLVSSDEYKFLSAIERLLNKKLERHTVAVPGSPVMERMPRPMEESARPVESRPRTKPKLEVQWGQPNRAAKSISAVPRHKRKPAAARPAPVAPFERFRRDGRSSSNG